MQLHRVQTHAPPQAPTQGAPIHDIVALERVRDLVLGGILFVDTFDRDDMPIADRIAATQDLG